MAEDEDLEGLGPVVLALLATADEETDEATGDEVEERPHRPMVLSGPERESGFPTPTGYRPRGECEWGRAQPARSTAMSG